MIGFFDCKDTFIRRKIKMKFNIQSLKGYQGYGYCGQQQGYWCCGFCVHKIEYNPLDLE